jgi:hypothetical protein
LAVINWHMISAWLFVLAVIMWGCWEFGWGGGDPNDPHHNRPPWNMW